MESIVCDIMTIAVILGAVIWATIEDRKEESKKIALCDRCKNLYYKRSPREKEYYRYVCKVPFKKPFNIPPEYCAQFEERRTNDPHIDT